MQSAKRQEVLAAECSIVALFYSAHQKAEFNDDVVAAVTGYSRSALRKFRVEGGGPAFIRSGGVQATDKRGRKRIFGGKVRYPKQSVLDWMGGRKLIRSTSEY